MRGLFGTMAAPVQRSVSVEPGSGGWLPFVGSVRSATGVAVSQSTAMRCSTVFACVTIIAEDIARAEPKLYHKLPDRPVKDADGSVIRVVSGGREEVTDHPLARLFRRPNRVQDWYQFAAFMERSIGLKSNAYALILRDGRGNPVELIPMNPDKVTVLEAADGSVFYQFAPTGLFELSVFERLRTKFSGFRVPAEHVLHFNELGFNMLVGASRIGFAADPIGLALGQEQQAGRWIGNGARPSVVLTTDQKLTFEAAKRIQADWEAMNAGLQNTGRTAVLEQGLKPSNLTLTSVDLEFLASRNFQVEDICRFYRVPPHKVAKTDRATNNNIAAQDSDYLNNTLSPKFTRWERRLKFHFDLDRQGLEVDFDLSDLFRADPATRMQTARQGVAGGILTQNEARRLYDPNLPPVDGGDVLLSPTNLAATGSNVSGSAPDGAGRPAEGEIKAGAPEVRQGPFGEATRGHPDQPRDERGRWTSSGVGVAATIEEAIGALEGMNTADAKTAIARALDGSAFVAFLKGRTAGFHPVAAIEEAAQAKIGTTARIAVLSQESAAKQTKHHPEMAPGDYKRLQAMLDGGEFRRETETRVALLHHEGRWYAATVKTAANGKEVLLLSFRRANDRTVKQLRSRTKEI